MKRHGLEKAQLKVSDGAIREMVASYTRESGVRVLERKLAAICRKAAMHLVSEGCKADPHHRKELKDYLGAPRYYRAPGAGGARGRGERPGLDLRGRRAAGGGGQWSQAPARWS